MESIEKVYPTVEELSKIYKNVNCPECSAIFNTESNLNLHLTRTHKKPNLLQVRSPNKVYHCPVVSCSYNDSAHFKQLKFLKQHFLKVHSKKDYVCSLCEKGFSTEASRNRHSEYCNVVFKCCDCEMFYGSYDTLKTHSRRKKHSILEKVAYKLQRITPNVKIPKSDESLILNKMRLLLPQPSSSMDMILIADTSEQSCQTEWRTNQSTQETQTLLGFRIPQLTVETQTIGDYFTRKPQSNGSLKSARTQTASTDPKSVSCNTLINMHDLELTFTDVQRNSSSTQTTVCNDLEDSRELLKDAHLCSMETQTECVFKPKAAVDAKTGPSDALLGFDCFERFDDQRSSSSTQTSIYNQSEYLFSASTSTHDSIHTDTSDLMTETFDSNYFNCNTETQTDFIFNDELFKYCDDYTSMYTQTCDELLLGEIGLSDTHTQTGLDDVLKSVESQTIMSQSRTPSFSCRDNVTHMETQTDMFKQMLEEINA